MACAAGSLLFDNRFTLREDGALGRAPSLPLFPTGWSSVPGYAGGPARRLLLVAWTQAGSESGTLWGMSTMPTMEESPSPAHEWRSLESLFGTERLSQFLGVSPGSVRRYRAGTRPTSDRLAARLHFLATLIGDLAGAYNDFGIRRWFERPRTALEGRSPAELMQGDWDPEDPRLQRVRELARSLTASPP